MKTKVLLLCLLLLPMLGCGTIHPRSAPDLEHASAQIRKVAILEPDLHVEMKYYRTDVYIESQSESDRISLLFARNVEEVLSRKGYEVSYLPASSQTEFPDDTCDKTKDVVAWRRSAALSLPEGMVMGPKKDQTEGYVRLIRRAEQITLQVISMDPAYDSEKLPERLFFLAPETELAKYDMVVISYGAMREETKSENRSRWIRNLMLNAAMLPVTLGSLIFPAVLPITLSVPLFINTTPDLSWVTLVAFDPRSGQVLFINDFSYKKGKTLNAVRRAAGILLEEFPGRTP